MSTRATVKFHDRHDTFYAYRHSDGFPGNVLPDIEETIQKTSGRWSGSGCGLLVTAFLAMHWDVNTSRLPHYEITTAFHGDESFRYAVSWSETAKKWDVMVED